MSIFRSKRTLHKDRAGNRLVRNPDDSISVENRQGKRVSHGEFKKFMKKSKARKSVRKSFF